MNAQKQRGGDPGSLPESPPSVGNSDKAADLATKDNLGFEDRVVKKTKDRILNMEMKDLFKLQLSRAQWEILFSPHKLEDTIRKVVRKEL